MTGADFLFTEPSNTNVAVTIAADNGNDGHFLTNMLAMSPSETEWLAVNRVIAAVSGSLTPTVVPNDVIYVKNPGNANRTSGKMHVYLNMIVTGPAT